MANMKFPLGRKAQAYYNTAGVLIIPTGTGGTVQESDITTWLADVATTAATTMRNLTLGLDSNRADTNTRETTAGGFMSETPVMKSAEITFDTPWDLNQTLITQMLDAWKNDTRMAFAFLNRDKDNVVSGDIVNGFSGNCWISLSKDENADDVQRGNWTITHADSGIWYEVTTP